MLGMPDKRSPRSKAELTLEQLIARAEKTRKETQLTIEALKKLRGEIVSERRDRNGQQPH